MSQDIIFKTEDYVFSYRVAGLLIRNNRILLQRPFDSFAYAISGGHVSLGETNESTLIREFKEEVNADIRVDSLQWVGEIIFPWGNKSCHQICLFYKVELTDEKCIPLDNTFFGVEKLNDVAFKLEFSWVDIDKISEIELYPVQAKKLLSEGLGSVNHFIYREE